MASTDPFTKAALFERALRGLLRPLLRALIAQGVTAPAFYRIVKQTFVDVAEKELGPSATDSRISVMTGVHRRDVKEFRSLDRDEGAEIGQRVSMLSTVIGRWMSDADYLSPDGSPAALPRSEADMPSFDGLVQSVSRDIRPRTVLDELQRQGTVSVDEDGTVNLMVEGLVGSADADQKLHFFSHNIGDHMSAAVENLLNAESPHLERAVFYNALTESSVATIEAQARDISLDALQRINALAQTHQATDKSKAEATHRFRFGVFFFNEDQGAED